VSKKVHIVVPMAGEGSRFANAGYTVPKPFIEFNGKMMIEHVLDSLAREGAEYTVIIKQEFKDKHGEQLAKLQRDYGLKFVTVNGKMQGAATTVMIIHKALNNATPVLFADCDNIFGEGVINRFLDDALERKLEGSLLTFHSTDPRYSFAKTDGEGRVVAMKEKEAISDHAICGAYYFGKGEDFVDATITNVIYGAQQKGEYYMSGAYNPLLERGARVGIYEIGDDEWYCVGTPQQLDEHLEKTKR
jgi:dTDP-glucose pyrophosphorylase